MSEEIQLAVSELCMCHERYVGTALELFLRVDTFIPPMVNLLSVHCLFYASFLLLHNVSC